jgi:predicted RNase H-like nuclease
MALVQAAKHLSGDQELMLVAVDMPVATTAITGRRAADASISQQYGGKGCSAHSPNMMRPGPVSEQLRDGLAAVGFPLATQSTPSGTPQRLIEVYPHPALLALLPLETYRVAYEVSKSHRYWPSDPVTQRIDHLLQAFNTILTGLQQHIDSLPSLLPSRSTITSLSSLKQYEDALDALVCAWVGIQYLTRSAKAYGNSAAAIWLPDEVYPNE